MNSIRFLPFFTAALSLLFMSFASAGSIDYNEPTSLRIPEEQTLSSALHEAETSSAAPVLIYRTFGGGGKNLQAWTDSQWANVSPGERKQHILDFFYANTRGLSRRGLRHTACFLGNPMLVAGMIDVRHNPTDSTYNQRISISSDGYAIGISAILDETLPTAKKRNPFVYHFRLPSCRTPGKNSLDPETDDLNGRDPSSFAVKALPKPAVIERLRAMILADQASSKATRDPQSAPAGTALPPGYGILDSFQIAPPGPGVPLLRPYVVSTEFEEANEHFSEARDLPWRKASIDLANPNDRATLSTMVLSMFYEGMFPQGVNERENVLYPEKNRNHYWCNMPWLDVGDTGREAVHGLTKERDLAKSPLIYPNPAPGADWGIGFYNAPGCRAINAVFGSRSNPRLGNTPATKPDYSRKQWNDSPGMRNAIFPDGSMSIKTLFTTADFPQLNGTHVMLAHVSKERGLTERTIQPVRLLQIDVAIKDTKLKGTDPQLDNWIMMTYYYDATYNPGNLYPGVPEGFRHMRPQGIQSGLAGNQSVLFPGSAPNGLGGRLNGPADNPKGGCLNCHATAGTKIAMVPGPLDNPSFLAGPDQGLEFSQQIALAKRNYQTTPVPGAAPDSAMVPMSAPAVGK